MIPSRSHQLPNGIKHLPKADLRREITAWRALVWAYADETLRAATDAASAPGHLERSAGVVRYTDQGRSNTQGCWLEVHEDAFAIDALVMAWFDHDGLRRDELARYAERRTPPPRQLDLQPLRCGPVYRANGAIKLEYPPRGRQVPYLCYVDYEGLPPHVVELKQRRQAELHGLFLALLDVMAGLRLSKWKILGRGLTDGGESLTRGSNVVVARSEA